MNVDPQLTIAILTLGVGYLMTQGACRRARSS